MKKLLLLGAPNAGKTTFFNEITSSHEKTGNWHGVTVAPKEKAAGEYLVVDLPGVYSLSTLSLEERVTKDYLLNNKNSCVLFVVSALDFLRFLPLLKEIVSLGIRPILLFTHNDTFEKRGGRLNAKELSQEIGLICVKKEDFSLENLPILAKKGEKLPLFLGENRHFQGYFLPKNKEKGRNFLLNPLVSIAVFFVCLLLTFAFAYAKYFPCDLVKSVIEKIFSSLSSSLAKKISSPFLRGFLCDCLLSGAGTLLSFLPPIAGLYFCLSLLEESGLLSYGAFALDDIFTRFGLNGRAVFSLSMGFGCTTTAVFSARALPSASLKRRTICSMQFVPCSARLPALFTVLSSLSEKPFLFVVYFYFLCLLCSLAVSLFFKGKEETILWELPRVQFPSLRKAIKDLRFPVKQFIMKSLRAIFTGLVAVWLFTSLNARLLPCPAEESMLAWVSKKLVFLIAPLGLKDWKILLSLLSGFAAKESMAGLFAYFYPTLLPFEPNALLAMGALVFLSPPCASCFAATAAEEGKKVAIQLFFLSSFLAYACAFCIARLGVGGGLLFAACLFFAAALKSKTYERIPRNRKHHPKKVHR